MTNEEIDKLSEGEAIDAVGDIAGNSFHIHPSPTVINWLDYIVRDRLVGPNGRLLRWERSGFGIVLVGECGCVGLTDDSRLPIEHRLCRLILNMGCKRKQEPVTTATNSADAKIQELTAERDNLIRVLREMQAQRDAILAKLEEIYTDATA